jgi:hypothetical protein
MLVTDIGYALAGLTAVGIVFIGARFLLAPSTAAAGFGIAAGTMAGRLILTCRSRASATSPRD